jgi:hypothetical protein
MMVALMVVGVTLQAATVILMVIDLLRKKTEDKSRDHPRK